ncbi:MAG: hypothetical protein AAGG01_06655 [Planctomycetota bacterium]
MPDLALHSGPLTDLFPAPSGASEWLQHALTGEQVFAFERDGFLTDIPVLTDQQVGALRE